MADFDVPSSIMSKEHAFASTISRMGHGRGAPSAADHDPDRAASHRSIAPHTNRIES